jgi:hypothetical protein
MATAMVVFAVFIGHEQITSANHALFLQSVKVSFAIFSALCTIGIFFSFSRGELRSGKKG